MRKTWTLLQIHLVLFLQILQQSPIEITNISKRFNLIIIMFNFVQFNLIITFQLNYNGLKFKGSGY